MSSIYARARSVASGIGSLVSPARDSMSGKLLSEPDKFLGALGSSSVPLDELGNASTAEPGTQHHDDNDSGDHSGCEPNLHGATGPVPTQEPSAMDTDAPVVLQPHGDSRRVNEVPTDPIIPDIIIPPPASYVPPTSPARRARAIYDDDEPVYVTPAPAVGAPAAKSIIQMSKTEERRNVLHKLVDAGAMDDMCERCNKKKANAITGVCATCGNRLNKAEEQLRIRAGLRTIASHKEAMKFAKQAVSAVVMYVNTEDHLKKQLAKAPVDKRDEALKLFNEVVSAADIKSKQPLQKLVDEERDC